MKIIAFGATSSTKSINVQLARLAASLVAGADVEVLDLNNYEMPLFSEDQESQIGQPQLAKEFLAKISDADAIIVSFAEHNGSYTAAYKNILDWSTRIDRNVFQNKPAIFLATSPGPGGASSVLATAVGSAQFFGADIKASLSIPSFYDNFDVETGTLRNPELQKQLTEVMTSLS